MLSPLRRLLQAGLLMALLALASAASAWAETTLKVIPQASLRVLDPIWTTAYLTRNHGYLVYDTLFALDANFKAQPQMVDTWTVSDNGLTYKGKPLTNWWVYMGDYDLAVGKKVGLVEK